MSALLRCGVNVITIDTASSIPPFEQVRTQIAGMINSGQLAAGAKLPTVRQLATDLGLAANTVARAYRELEADGVIVTRGRQGTFVRSAAIDQDQTSPELTSVTEAAAGYVRVARATGLSTPEALRLVEDAWGNG